MTNAMPKKIRCPYHSNEELVRETPQLLSCGCQAQSRHDTVAEARSEAQAIDGRVVEADGAFFVVVYQPTQVG
jgi:hypothetical protein